MTAPTTGATSWVPATSGNVYTLGSTGRPTIDVDGGPLGRDPAVMPGNAVVTPSPITDPALAVIGPLSAPFGKWGTQASAAPVVLTYSFYDGTVPIYPAAPLDVQNPAALDAGHRNAVRAALASFADVANLTFVEITETTTGAPTDVFGASGALVGQLRFIDDRALDNNSFTAAYGGTPAQTVTSSGLVGFDVDRFGVADDLSRGGQVFGIIEHEIGHALGLTHPFDGGDAAPVAGDPRSAYGAWHTGWTMMAYTAPGLDLVPTGQRVDAVGPMVADVAVLQAFYGANRTTRTGDDVYRLDGRFPQAAIWDAGGTDTIDASQATVTLAGEQGPGAILRRPGDALPAIGWFTAWSGIDLDLRPGQVGPHVQIAFGAAIENAVGSRGHDRIIGTDSGILTAGDGTTVVTDGANRLDGGAGDDTILGLGGDDILIGGSGNNLLDGGDGADTALFGVASSGATIARDGNDLIITTAGATDRLRNVELLTFADRSIAAADALSVLAPTVTPSTPTAPPPAAIDPSRRILMMANGVGRELEMTPYVGPVSWLQNLFITDLDGADEAMHGSPLADFIHSRDGNDAIDGDAGDDVLDGGTESNFLTGGAGNDTFFLDGRGGGVTWSTVTDLAKGEWITAWGWRQGVSKLTWEEMAGAEGYKGATARIDLDGNGSIDMSLTIGGQRSGAIFTVTGTQGSDPYIAFSLR